MRGSSRARAVRRCQFPSSPTTPWRSGLNFVQENGGTSGRMIPPVTASGGVGLLDFDNDGWLDVYLVQGGAFPPDASPHPSAAIAYSETVATALSRT